MLLSALKRCVQLVRLPVSEFLQNKTECNPYADKQNILSEPRDVIVMMLSCKFFPENSRYNYESIWVRDRLRVNMGW